MYGCPTSAVAARRSRPASRAAATPRSKIGGRSAAPPVASVGQQRQFGLTGALPAQPVLLPPVPRVDFRFAPEPAEPERATVGSTGGEVDEARAGVAEQTPSAASSVAMATMVVVSVPASRARTLDADPAELGIRFIQRPRARRVVGVDHQPHARATARGDLPTVPPAAAFAYLDWPGPIPSPTGAAREVPENTLPAFEHAVGLGYRYVETDVHVTADGVLLAFHDECSTASRIARAGWATSVVGRARGPGRGGRTDPAPRGASRHWPDLRVNIDPKHDGAVEGTGRHRPSLRRRRSRPRRRLLRRPHRQGAGPRVAGACQCRLGPGGSLQLGLLLLASWGRRRRSTICLPLREAPPPPATPRW